MDNPETQNENKQKHNTKNYKDGQHGPHHNKHCHAFMINTSSVVILAWISIDGSLQILYFAWLLCVSRFKIDDTAWYTFCTLP
jgi:hypothetical protein